MASDDARARQGERVAVQPAADSAEPVRTRQVSGCAAKPTLDARMVLDEDRESENMVETESTLITPRELIETLREASRSGTPLKSLTAAESHQPYFSASEVNEPRDEDDTSIFVLYEDGDLRSSWIRRVVALSGAAALTSLVALRADPTPAPVIPGKAEKELVARAPRVRPLTIPTVVQLQPSAPLAEESAVESSAEGNAAERAQQNLDSQRRWMRALDRGNARLSAREYESAVFSFERAIEYHPEDSKAYAGLAEAQLALGKWSEAVKAFQEAIALSPNDASLRLGLSRAYAQAGRDDMAIQPYYQATEPDPSNSE